jgi:hypothetical protein
VRLRARRRRPRTRARPSPPRPVGPTRPRRPFATEICTWDGKGTYDGPAREEDGYTGADCWKAAPDPANEDDVGRNEQNKENRATDWECDMLHDQHDVFYKVLIGLFYICPLTAFVISCISQAHPEGGDKFWGYEQPAKVAPANM